MDQFYVYVYYDPRVFPQEPIYVGKGKGSRWKLHLRTARNAALSRKIAKIRAMGLEPVVLKLVEGLTQPDAMAKERELIASYGRLHLGTGTLCNFTEGGEGTVGYRHRESTRKLFSNQRKGKNQTEAQYLANCSRSPASPETCAKRSKANKGRSLPREQVEKIRQAHLGRKPSAETRALWSQQRRGRKLTTEHIEKVKAAKAAADAERRATMTPQEWEAYRTQTSRKIMGQKRSEETKARMRAAWILRRLSAPNHDDSAEVVLL